MSCVCTPTARDWQPDGDCKSCGHTISESQLQDGIRLALGRMQDVTLFRNNIGHAVMAGNRRVTFGVGGPGGADLLGMFSIAPTERALVAADLLETNGFVDEATRLRRTVCFFLAIEIKTPRGRQSPEQRQFQTLVESKGGIYLMPRSVQHAVSMLEALRTGVCQ